MPHAAPSEAGWRQGLAWVAVLAVTTLAAIACLWIAAESESRRSQITSSVHPRDVVSLRAPG